jgi:hypothetical protein
MCRCDCGRFHPAANAGDVNPNTIMQMTAFMVRTPEAHHPKSAIAIAMTVATAKKIANA